MAVGFLALMCPLNFVVIVQELESLEMRMITNTDTSRISCWYMSFRTHFGSIIKCKHKHFFRTAHVLFFSVCLSELYPHYLGRIISHLEKGMLKLLAENERIASFSPTLHKRLRQAYESSTAKVKFGRPQVTLLQAFVVLFLYLQWL